MLEPPARAGGGLGAAGRLEAVGLVAWRRATAGRPPRPVLGSRLRRPIKEAPEFRYQLRSPKRLL